MENKFKTGDKVRLVSGGPTMTIAEKEDPPLHSQEMFRCLWFNGNKLKEAWLPADALERVEN